MERTMKHKTVSAVLMIFAMCLLLGSQFLVPGVSLAEDGSFDRIWAEMEGVDQEVALPPALQGHQTYKNA